MDVEKVRADARTILDKFGAQLESIKVSSNYHKETKDLGTRKEKKANVCDSGFRAIMFKNAPKKDEEYLILEKGSW